MRKREEEDRVATTRKFVYVLLLLFTCAACYFGGRYYSQRRLFLKRGNENAEILTPSEARENEEALDEYYDSLYESDTEDAPREGLRDDFLGE